MTKPFFNPLCGTLSRDPRFEVLPDGSHLVTFALIVPHLYNPPSENDIDEVLCEAEGDVADLVRRYCFSGQIVVIEGEGFLNALPGHSDDGPSRMHMSYRAEKIWFVDFRHGADGTYCLRRRCPFLRYVWGPLAATLSFLGWPRKPIPPRAKVFEHPEDDMDIPF
jgi:hypothetical protein